MEIHLDPLGGWSGDMFAAGMLDAFPEHWAAVEMAVASLGLGPDAACRLVAHRDRAGLTGRRFVVAAEEHEAHPPTPLHKSYWPHPSRPPEDEAPSSFPGTGKVARPKAETDGDLRRGAPSELPKSMPKSREDAARSGEPHPSPLRADTFPWEGKEDEPRPASAAIFDDHSHEQEGNGIRSVAAADQGHAHRDPHRHHDHPPHAHRRWRDIQEMLAHARLPAAARDHAIGIFTLLAAAEAEVHGVREEDVTFHEVGALDSIVDIVAAGQLIALAGASAWSASPLPLGSGRVRTQHGLLPVPAPATALLLRGLATIDDGVPGERVTPTGAAIARYLLVGTGAAREPRRLARSGTGFGSRELSGISNCLRVLVFEPEPAVAPALQGIADFTHRELGVITFEVDDLSAEDLANGLDHIRAMSGVHDVIQSVAFGKKGRMATQVQVLAAPEALETTIRACFTETTTIGLRFHTVRGAALRRIAETVEVEGRSVRVKLVERPGGLVTAKAEASDVAADRGHAARAALRHEAGATAVRHEGHRFARSAPEPTP